MDQYIGRLLDNRYEILEIIGTGGMAVVYKARCHRLNRLVAIKILKDEFARDEEFRRRFRAEGEAVAMLGNPNIVQVYDVSSTEIANYIVMELIEGITLKQYLEKRGSLNWKETLHFAMQIAKALEHAHSRGIVHRDIKPHNVMVLKNGSVKVTDFGIARMMSKGNTLTKEALGSVHYISPEQAKGGRVDNRSDIYSLGVVMYEMMSGRPPYDGDSPVAVAIQHINGGAAMPSTLNPNIPGGLEQIIMKAMALEPNDRYASAAQMLVDMDDFRKDPAVLFDYNVPPTDAVTSMPKAPIVMDINTPRTTAERVAGRSDSTRRQTSGSRTPRTTGSTPRTTTGRPPERRTSPSGTRTPGSSTGRTPRPTDPQQRSRQTEEQRRRREEEERSRNRIAIIAIVVCALLAIASIGVFLFLWLGNRNAEPKMVEVPKLVGENYNNMPEYADFNIKVLDEVFDNDSVAGTILKQDPAAGTLVEPGQMVFITVSMGAEPKVGVMSDLRDYPQVFAEANLNQMDMGLTIRIEQEYSDEIEEGKVVRTEPVADTALSEGQEVVLYISMGREIKTGFMPNIVDIDEDLAVRTLNNQELDLDIQIEEIFDSEIEEGNVIKTKPEKGDPLKTGQTVILYISKGPETAEMPDLVGKDLNTAKSLLDYAGFKNVSVEEVYDSAEAGQVISQSHAKKTKVDITETIKLKVSKGPEPTEPPELTKDITIDLRGCTDAAACNVKVVYKTAEVFNETVEQGVEQIVLYGMKGVGQEKFTVIINDGDSWDEWVDFTA
jgi:serine/threonine-protein kinase